MLSRRDWLRAAGMVAVGGVTGCGLRGPEPLLDQIAVAGGEAGGTFVKLARLLAAELALQRVARTASVAPSDGTVENLALLQRGEVQLAPTLADGVATRDVSDLRAIARLFQNTLHCIVRAEGPIREIGDLVGRRIAVGSPASGTADTAVRLLVLAGVGDEQDLGGLWQPQSPADAAIRLAGGVIDAMFWWGGLPAPEIVSVTSVTRLRALPLGDLAGPANRLTAGVYQETRLPDTAYGQQDVATVGTASYLMCRADLDDDVVARVVDVVAGSGRRLVPQPANGIQYLVPGSLIDTEPVPLHPAAAQRYLDLHG